MPDINKNLGMKVKVSSQDQTGPGLRDAGNNLKKFQEQLHKTQQAARSLVTVGAELAAMGAALSALTIFPITTAKSFERAMSGVRAVTEGTAKEFEEMAKVAKDLGATTRFTATEAANGLRALGMAGLEANEIMKALPPTLDLAAAGELDVGEAAKISANLMREMQLSVDDLGHVMDVLANTASSATTDVRELSEAAKYVASTAAVAGINIDELGAYLKVLADNGKQGTVAGTALRGVIIALNKVTPKAQDALDRLNVQIAKNTDGTVNYVETFKRLRDANIGVADAVDIFRRTSFEAALNIAQNVETIEDFTEANRKATGAANTMAKTMEDNLQGAIISLESALEGLRIALGEPFLGPLKNAVEELTKYVRVLRDIVTEHPEATKTILTSIGVLGGLSAILGSILTTTGLLILAVTNLISAYKVLIATKIGAYLSELMFGFGGLTGSIEALTIALGSLTAAQALTVAGIIAISGYYVTRAINAFGSWLSVIVENRVASAAWREEMEKHKGALGEEAKSIAEVSKLTYDQALAYKKTLKEKIQYYTAAVASQERISKDATKERETLQGLQYDYKILHDRIRDIKPMEPLPDSVRKSFDVLADSVEAAQKQYERFTDVYDKISAEVKKYTDKVIAWDADILWSKLTTQEKINAIREQDTQSHAELIAKQSLAEKGLTDFRETLAQKDFEAADNLAKKVKDLYSSAVEYGSSALDSIKSHFDDVITSAERAYKAAVREVEKYGEEVLKIEREIRDAKKTGEEILRDLNRKTMTEEERWNDQRKEAEEDLRKLKKLGAEQDEVSLRDALKLADEAIGKYRDLATQVTSESGTAGKTIKETTDIAKRGIEEILKVKQKIYDELLAAANDARSGAEEEAASIKEKLDEAVKLREAVIEVKLKGLDDVKASLDALEADIRTVKVKVETTKSGGGAVHTFSKGGRLPGESKVDSIPVLARPGEWFIRNEAAHFWDRIGGPAFMSGINDPWSKAGEGIRNAINGLQKFNVGGMVKSILPRFAEGGSIAFDSSKLANALGKIEALASSSGVRSLEMQNLGRLELGVGGHVYPVLGNPNTLEQLKSAIEKENLVRSNF